MVTGTTYNCPKCRKPTKGCVLDRPCFDCSVERLIEEHSDLLMSLARDITCPRCRKRAQPPFYNLGEKFNSFEGCKACYKELSDE